MKVKIQDVKSGRVREMEQRYADIMVKSKRATYYDQTVPVVTSDVKPVEKVKKPRKKKVKNAGTYENRMMTSDNSGE